MLSFFQVKYPPKLNIPLEQQRLMWFQNFIKAFLVVFLAYFAMYLIRNNFKVAQPYMKDQLGFTTTQLGQIGFAFSITYGIGKTALGYFIDGKNSKRFVSLLLIISSIAVFGVGMLMLTTSDTSIYSTLLILWGVSGFFQSAGGPASYSTITKWAAKKNRGRWLGWWNISHNVGGALAGVFAVWGMNTFFGGLAQGKDGVAVAHVAGMFIVPSVLALLIGIIGLFIGHDSPEDIGMDKPEVIFNEAVEPENVASESMTKFAIFKKYVLLNPYMWVLCIANIFVYIVRIGIDNWSALYVVEHLHVEKSVAVSTLFWFEIGAMAGSFSWGWTSDLLKGRRAFVAILCMFAMLGAIWLYATAETIMTVNIALFICGILIFGPQLLIGISLVGFVPKKAVTVANGTTGTFGYLFGDSIAKIGLARIADPTKEGLVVFGHTLHGWGSTFTIMYASAIVAIALLTIVAFGEERKIRASAKAVS